jgi:hypothetical protein
MNVLQRSHCSVQNHFAYAVKYRVGVPFSLSRLVQVTETGQVIYEAEKDACRAFPDPQDEGLASEPTRNSQILDPLICPRCSGQMKIVAFLESPQGDVIEKILRHCGLWCPAAPRAPPGGDLRVHDLDSDWDSDATSRKPRESPFAPDRISLMDGNETSCPLSSQASFFRRFTQPAEFVERAVFDALHRSVQLAEDLFARHAFGSQ